MIYCNILYHKSCIFQYNLSVPVLFTLDCAFLVNLRPQFCGLHSQVKGISHELNKCPPDTYLPWLRQGRSFDSRTGNKKKNSDA
jgi:hypothetical protein